MTDSEDPHHIYVSDNTLTVNRFVENDAGFYTCKLFNANNGFIEKKEFNVACQYILHYMCFIIFFLAYLISIKSNYINNLRTSA